MLIFRAGDYNGNLKWNLIAKRIIPICLNMIGGILLLQKVLEENADKIYVKSDNLPVAYASNDVNSTANTARGSLNLKSSHFISI